MEKGNYPNALKFYSHALIQLLIEPALFFRTLPDNISAARVWGFLGGCACFFALASLLTGTGQACTPAVMALIFAANGMGMVLLGAAIGYVVMVLAAGKKTSLFLVFSVYVFSSGITWMISWLPFMLWFTEPWRWWLTMNGFRFSCGLSTPRAAGVVLVSVLVQWSLIYSAMQAFMG